MNAESRAVEASSEQYDLCDAVPAGGLTAVPGGTNLLVAGPSMLGTDRIAMDILARGVRLGEHAVIVTPDRPADRVLSQYEELARPDGPVLQIVDCSAASDSGWAGDGERVKDVSSPGNLTDIGVGLTKATGAIGDGAAAGVRISLLSLSTFLQYTDFDRVFKFVHVLTGRFAAAGYLCVATIDTAAQDDRTLNKIKAQFDGVVQLREAQDGTREARALGFPEVTTAWESF